MSPRPKRRGPIEQSSQPSALSMSRPTPTRCHSSLFAILALSASWRLPCKGVWRLPYPTRPIPPMCRAVLGVRLGELSAPWSHSGSTRAGSATHCRRTIQHTRSFDANRWRLAGTVSFTAYGHAIAYSVMDACDAAGDYLACGLVGRRHYASPAGSVGQRQVESRCNAAWSVRSKRRGVTVT